MLKDISELERSGFLLGNDKVQEAFFSLRIKWKNVQEPKDIGQDNATVGKGGC